MIGKTIRVDTCFAVPTAKALEREFLAFGRPRSDDRYPCRRSRDIGPGLSGPRVQHQCAVRMSVALCRSMNVDIFSSYRGGGIHSARCCAGSRQFRHLTRAQNLFDHLENTLLFDFQPCGGLTELLNIKGIIFFRHCFNTGNRGSHIDYWNGITYTNSAAGNAAASRGLPLFQNATGGVFFFRLV